MFSVFASLFINILMTLSIKSTVSKPHLCFPTVLGHLVKAYVDTIASGAVPCLENAVIAMAMIENEAAVQEGLEVYQSGMEQLKNSFPLELNEITSEHQCFSLMATQTFMKHSFKDSDGKYLTSLEVGESGHDRLQQYMVLTHFLENIMKLTARTPITKWVTKLIRRQII